MSDNKETIGLIGLGAMGRGTALNLLRKGFQVVGYDIRKESLDWLEEEGGKPCRSVAELASQTKIVISFVINSAQTEAVLYGDDSLVRNLKPGSVVIACSTMPPEYVRNLSERLSKDSVSFVDAPVSGGTEGALNGTLTVMGSGDDSAMALSRHVLEAIGSKVYNLGPAGAGTQMKLINQLLVGANLAAASEAMALAKHMGLPLETTLEILKSGAANSWMISNRGPKMVSESFDEVNGSVDIFVKDLSLVLESTQKSLFPARLAHSAYLSFIEASARGRGSKDCAIVIRNYEMSKNQES